MKLLLFLTICLVVTYANSYLYMPPDLTFEDPTGVKTTNERPGSQDSIPERASLPDGACQRKIEEATDSREGGDKYGCRENQRCGCRGDQVGCYDSRSGVSGNSDSACCLSTCEPSSTWRPEWVYKLQAVVNLATLLVCLAIAHIVMSVHECIRCFRQDNAPEQPRPPSPPQDDSTETLEIRMTRDGKDSTGLLRGLLLSSLIKSVIGTHQNTTKDEEEAQRDPETENQPTHNNSDEQEIPKKKKRHHHSCDEDTDDATAKAQREKERQEYERIRLYGPKAAKELTTF